MISRNSINGAFPVKRLAEVVEFLDNRRRPVTESDRRAGPYPYYGANGLQGTIDDFIFDEPLVLLAEDGGHFGDPDRGIAYRVSGKTWVNNHAHVLRPTSAINLSYLCRVLENYDVAPFVTGTTRGKLTKAGASEITIPVPPLPEQRRIAEVLDRAEALRAKRRASLAQLDSLTQSLFLDLFGDPATNPKGWPKATLGDVAEMLTGYPFRSEEYVTNGDSVRLCRGANVLPGRIDWSDIARWPKSKTGALGEFDLQPGDVVIAMDRPWISEGFKIAQMQPKDCPALLVQRVTRLRGKTETPNEFLFHLLNQPLFTRHCRPTETTIPHISPKDIRSFTFPAPPTLLQREFARRARAVEKLKTTHRASLSELDALFATLQHRAFRGEL